MICDVCGLPDLHGGRGDGLGSCGCPRCPCDAARTSVLCVCPLDGDEDPYDDDQVDEDDGQPWPDDVVMRPIETSTCPSTTRSSPMPATNIRPRLALEAIQLDRNTAEVCQWLAQTISDQYRTDTHPFDAQFDVVTFRDSRDEEVCAINGDWIVKGPHGFFIVKPGDFANQYEPLPAATGPRVHIAGADIQIGNLLRQCCAWCGLILIDYDLERIAVPEGQDGGPSTWPVGALVEVDGPMSTVVDHADGQPLPDNACSRVDMPTAAGSEG